MIKTIICFFKFFLVQCNLTFLTNDLEVIKQYGFEDFIIYPRKMSDGSRSLVTKFNLNADLIKNILKKKYGEYILETDVANLIPSKKSEKVDDLCKTLPEFKKFYDNLFSNEILNERRATFNPYILAMNMEVKYRPLAVLAIEDMFKTKNFEVINRHRFSIHVLVRFIQEYSPQINSYLKVAKEYQIKEILPIKNDFEKVCDIYSGVWNGSN